MTFLCVHSFIHNQKQYINGKAIQNIADFRY